MNNQYPKVTAILTTYNRANLVGAAMRSILAQTYQDFELIVVDDASCDHTKEVVQGFDDQRIRYVAHKKNKGAATARNTGIKMARGKYIALLDDDDEWLPDKLKKQVQKIEEASDKVGLIYSGSEIRAKDTNAICRVYHPKLRGNVRRRLLVGSMVGGTGTLLIKKECFSKVGLFDEELQSCQDWDMWKRISDCYESDFVPEIVTRIYRHRSQISTDLESLIRGRARMVEKYIGEFRRHPDILVIHLKRLGKLHCINGSWGEAWRWFKQALKVNILEIIKIAAWCIIELPIVKFFSRAKHFKRYRPEKSSIIPQ